MGTGHVVAGGVLTSKYNLSSGFARLFLGIREVFSTGISVVFCGTRETPWLHNCRGKRGVARLLFLGLINR